MDADNHPQEMESFPVLQLIISFVIWILPPAIAAIFLSLSTSLSSILTIIVLLSVCASVPVSAFIFYRNDISRNNGYVSTWGFR